MTAVRVREAAAHFGVSPTTIKAWVARGRLLRIRKGWVELADELTENTRMRRAPAVPADSNELDLRHPLWLCPAEPVERVAARLNCAIKELQKFQIFAGWVCVPAELEEVEGERDVWRRSRLGGAEAEGPMNHRLQSLQALQPTASAAQVREQVTDLTGKLCCIVYLAISIT